MKLFFSGQLQLKVWFATIAMALAAFQLFTAFAIYGKLGDRSWPKWFPGAHRLSGILAFIFSLPVAYHCLWSLGFAETNGRAVAHSFFGCVFYGAFASKVLAVRSSGLPKNVLPLVGGLTFAALTIAWLTSSVWFLTSDLGEDLLMKTLVRVAEIVAAVAAVVFVLALFVNEPDEPDTGRGGDVADDAGDGAPEPIDPAQLYSRSCAGCHGSDGQGGFGPQLGGGAVVEEFPDPADQLAMIRNGQGSMPGFDELSAEELDALVIYTREELTG